MDKGMKRGKRGERKGFASHNDSDGANLYLL